MKSEWISVEDEKPKAEVRNLVAFGGVVKTGLREVTVYGDRWFDDRGFQLPPVTHWQPLPDPPEQTP